MAAISTGLGIAALGAGLFSGLANTGVNIAMQKDAQAFNAEEAAKQREWSSAEAQKQREYEERLSNTAYQRALSDMKAAGINPNVLGMSGGASTPSSSIPSGFAAHAASHNPAAFNSSYFGSLMSTAVSRTLHNNNGFREEVFKQMKATNAKEIAGLEKALYEATKNPIYAKNGGFTIL